MKVSRNHLETPAKFFNYEQFHCMPHTYCSCSHEYTKRLPNIDASSDLESSRTGCTKLRTKKNSLPFLFHNLWTTIVPDTSERDLEPHTVVEYRLFLCLFSHFSSLSQRQRTATYNGFVRRNRDVRSRSMQDLRTRKLCN